MRREFTELVLVAIILQWIRLVDGCEPGTFGQDCSLQCHCPEGDECSPVDGLCESHRCHYLWDGPSCQTEKPRLSQAPSVEELGQRTVRLHWRSWTAGLDPGDTELDIFFYHVQIQLGNSSEWTEVGKLTHLGLGTAEYRYTVDSLQPHSMYRFRLTLSWLDSGKPVESTPGPQTDGVWTLCDAPEPPQVTQSLVTVTPHSITVGWRAPTEIHCDQVSHYVVYLTCNPTCGDSIEESPDAMTLSTTFTNLPLDTEYHVSVVAINNEGISSVPSDTVKVSPDLTVTLEGSTTGPSSPTTPTVFIHHVIESYEERPLPDSLLLQHRTNTSLVLVPDVNSIQNNAWPDYLQAFLITVDYHNTKLSTPIQDPGLPTINASHSVLLVSGLLPASSYLVHMATRGYRPQTTSWVFWTTPSEPGTPEAPQVVNITDYNIIMNLPITEDEMYRDIGSYLVIVEKSNLSLLAEMVDNRDVLPLKIDRRLPYVLTTADGRPFEFMKYNESVHTDLNYYVTAEFDVDLYASDSSVEFVLGDGKIYGTYENVRLTPESYYVIWYVLVRANDGATTFSFTRVPSDVKTLPAAIARSPTVEMYDNKILIIVLTIVLLLVIIIFLVLLFMWLKRRHVLCGGEDYFSTSTTYAKAETISDFNGNNSNSNSSEPNFRSNTDMVDIHNLSTGIRIRAPKRELDDSYCIVKKSNPILAKKLRSYINLREHSEYKLEDEFKHLPQGQVDTANTANLPQNVVFNRSAIVVPFDKNKVKLCKLSPDDVPYINASFVRSLNNRYFLVTQSPMSTTMGEFWRMVWEQNAGTIVMLMNLTEKGKPEYDRYWPERPNQPYIYHNIEVQKISEERTSHYVQRKFRIGRIGVEEQVREVSHWQFISWAAAGAPFHAIPFLDFVRRIQDQSQAGVNTVVHCHTGGGRSGLYVALDSLLIQGRQTGRVDILKCVTLLRTERVNMIKTLKQYKFLHESLAEAFDHSETRIYLDRFMFAFENIIDVEGKKGYSVLAREFESLPYSHPTPLSTPQSFRDYSLFCSPLKNKEKQRAEVPLMSTMLQDSDQDKYAVTCLDGYIKKDTFLITRPPSIVFLDEFWDAVFEHGARIIVMLNRSSDSPATYWPTAGGTFICGPYSITCEAANPSLNRHRNSMVHELKVSFNEKTKVKPRSVMLYELLAWPAEREVPAVQTLLDLMVHVRRYWLENSRGRPIVLHSSCGTQKSRASLFAVLWCLVERMEVEPVVDVFSAVRFNRAYLPSAVPSLEQYRYLYRCLREMVKRREMSDLAGCSITPANSLDMLTPNGAANTGAK